MSKIVRVSRWLPLFLCFLPGVFGAEPKKAEELAPRYLLVRPVVARSDAGAGAAPVRLNQARIQGVYHQAGVRMVWLPAVYLDSTAARDGTIGPDTIVALGKERKLWKKGEPGINLIFVNAINGKKGPRGLGMTPGPICFVALPEKEEQPDMEAFCIAHEMGHCLGLIHAVDDPEVDNQVVSIMGDGPFAERIGPKALHPPHVKTIRASRLLLLHNVTTVGQERTRGH